MTTTTNRDPGGTGTNIVDVIAGVSGGTKIFEVTIIAAVSIQCVSVG